MQRMPHISATFDLYAAPGLRACPAATRLRSNCPAPLCATATATARRSTARPAPPAWRPALNCAGTRQSAGLEAVESAAPLFCTHALLYKKDLAKPGNALPTLLVTLLAEHELAPPSFVEAMVGVDKVCKQ